jgi:uncharacterized membrane protein
VFSGRGAFIHVGAFIGTIMAVNVFGVIIPNQKKIVASLMAHEPPDPRLGAIGKQRSVHNNYLTLPVLVMMVSSHYPMLTSHPHPWLVVALIVVIGASVRHFLNRHDAGDPLPHRLGAAGRGGRAGAAMWLTAPRTDARLRRADGERRRGAQHRRSHCVMCHSAHPTHEGFEAPPKDVALDTHRRHPGPCRADSWRRPYSATPCRSATKRR